MPRVKKFSKIVPWRLKISSNHGKRDLPVAGFFSFITSAKRSPFRPSTFRITTRLAAEAQRPEMVRAERARHAARNEVLITSSRRASANSRGSLLQGEVCRRVQFSAGAQAFRA